MANLREEYTQHIQDTAPDMDKLWNRISEEIDKKEAENMNETTYTENRQQINRSGGYMKIAAVAAAFIVVFAGINIMNESKKTKAAMDNIPLSRPDRTEETASEKNDGNTTTNGSADNKTDQKSKDDRKEATFDVDGYYNMTDGASEAVKSTVKYNQLRLTATDTVAYVADYIPQGDEYFVEDKVFKSTDLFVDVTVLDAELSADKGATYTLQVNAAYDKNGTTTDTELVINSSTPYILQRNREYLLPLKITGANSYSIVFENAPQIEITLDGGAVFQNGWTALDSSAQSLEKDSLSVNDFYFDRMKYTPELDMESFLEQWNNA
jgi:cytoskeletal protein RodZ